MEVAEVTKGHSTSSQEQQQQEPIALSKNYQ